LELGLGIGLPWHTKTRARRKKAKGLEKALDSLASQWIRVRVRIGIRVKTQVRIQIRLEAWNRLSDLFLFPFILARDADRATSPTNKVDADA